MCCVSAVGCGLSLVDGCVLCVGCDVSLLFAVRWRSLFGVCGLWFVVCGSL